MQGALVSLALSGLGSDALKVAAGLLLAVVIAIGFAASSLASFLGAPAAAMGAPAAALAGRGSTQPAQPSLGSTGSAVVQVARSQIGRPYVWGGASAGASFDCSGLVQWAFGQVGVALPRTAQQQFDASVRIATDQLAPGDLVFFAQTYPSPTDRVTHVGIYVGDGLMVNAPTVGDVVREMPVFTGFFGAHYAGAGRLGR